MKYKLTIPGLLPGANEYIGAERSNKYQAAAMKKQAEHIIGYMIKSQLKGVKLTRPVVMTYCWVEPNRRRDKSNIAFAKKFIEDALVRCGVLKDDGWDEIDNFADSFKVDQKNPRVEVIIEEMEAKR
jgi:Holliday junction resolvase RusA-like endonuclease